MTLLRWVSTVVVVGALAGGVYYTMQGRTPDGAAASRRSGMGAGGPVAVVAKNADTADVPVYLEGVGSVKALNTATVRAQVDGRLLSINFTEGEDVKKGDVLAKIDPVTYQAQLDQAIAKKALDEALLANTRKDLERFQKVGTLAISQQQIDTQIALIKQQEAQVKSDTASIENATAILGYTTIVAPFDGRTGIRLVDEGNLVRGGDAGGIAVITQVQPISVVFTLPQQQLPTLTKSSSEGTLVAHALSTDSQTELDTGTLKVIDNQVDQQTGTIRLKAEFPNDKRQLWPGQFVNVRLLVDTLKGVVVAPTEAVQRGPDGTYVYVVGANNTAEMRQVKISRQDDKFAVIAEGLTAGEKIVTSGFGRLKDGAAVSVTDGSAAPAEKPAVKKKPSDGKQAADADKTASSMQAAQAAAQASPEAALVTGSTSEGGKRSGKHSQSHRDSGASP
ncbi:efflux RND transporter periplasmic adaptor subunit [Hyphomicrobium sp.]|uniref:efflux RND transporter periplasmic adaptor subunit n=1 Tax=Hyphomicrobium sp. TaxID=82 RepID=UPI001D20AB2B|nr:efflux RND transporter periplasmic adaptor subunit [Hyphomicrobium sp.]MBY0561320.1 efflux RND transporter periplasmic adaptor subunit [Hyphomicrobium sp.]